MIPDFETARLLILTPKDVKKTIVFVGNVNTFFSMSFEVDVNIL